MRRILFTLALVSAAALWAWILVELFAARPVEARAVMEIPDLDRLEARMVHATEITRRWEMLAERHAGASELVCEQMATVAMTWEVR